MEIPKIIQETAEKEGCNRITYLGKRNGKDAYTMGYVSEDGSLPCPTGLPTVYLYDGKTLETISIVVSIKKHIFAEERLHLGN